MCILLEAPTIDNVILYFQSLYSENSQFELRGINIEEVQANVDQNLDNNITNSDLSGNTTQESKSTDISFLIYISFIIFNNAVCYFSPYKHLPLAGISLQSKNTAPVFQ
jgi:hypothetical protein